VASSNIVTFIWMDWLQNKNTKKEKTNIYKNTYILY